MYITCEQYEYLLESVTSSHEYYPSLSHCTFTREFFSLSSKNKKKKILHNLISPTRRWTTSSTPLMSNQWFEISIWEWNKEKKKRNVHNLQIRIDRFHPFPKRRKFRSNEVLRATKRRRLFSLIDEREGGREERRRKEERRWRMNGSFPFLVPPLPFTTRQSHASILRLLSRN